ncbi:MAG: hypothetical protein ACI4AD_02760 [Roseburia sp.]
MENQYFTEALADFTHDMASGGAIRHLADLGYTVREISAALDFPTPMERIRKTVWKHYVDTGVICLTDSGDVSVAEKVSYVKEYGKYGKTSLRRVVEKIEHPTGEYIACDFGKQIYQDKAGFEKKLDVLEPRDKEYILGLPWPLARVYHVADERMKRIQDCLNGCFLAR